MITEDGQTHWIDPSTPKFIGNHLQCAFSDMLDLIVPEDGESLKDHAGRDEMKIFLLMSLVESIAKIRDKKSQSRELIKDFCNGYFDENKKIIENKIKLKLKNEKKERQIKFKEFILILYKIRCNFTHRGEYIHQLFLSSSIDRNSHHKYGNVEALQKGNVGEMKWLNNVENLFVSIDFVTFQNMINGAIRKYLQ